MKRLLLSGVTLAHAAALLAQLHGNEWIDHDRRYWKFEVAADGVYRIDSATLAQSGFPIATVDARHLMLFGKEQQVPIYVHGESDGVLNAGDYIEFHATKADGQVDKRMYPYPDANPNPYVSLYGDSVRYYLTWDETAPALHMGAYANADYASHAPRPWAWFEGIQTYNLIYWAGLLEPTLQQIGIGTSLSPMLESEGFGGLPLYNDGSTNLLDIQDAVVVTPGVYPGPDAPDATVTATVAAQNNPGNSSLFNHHTRWLYGPALNTVGRDTIYSGARTIRGIFDIPVSVMGPATTIRYNAPHDLDGPGQVGAGLPNYLDWQVVSNVRIRYPRSLAIGGGGPLRMEVPGSADPMVRLDVSAFVGTPVIYAYGDSVRRVAGTFNGSAWQFLFPAALSQGLTPVVVFGQETVQPITGLRPVTPSGYFTDFAAMDIDSAMLIVTHASLMSSAALYANYRENQSPNRYNTLVADVDELYDQFGGGIPKQAYAIRAFCRYLIQQWSTRPRALFLIGKSVNTWSAFFSGLPSINPDAGGARARCLVPSYGYPSSDQAFTTGLELDTRRMDIPVGRLSANTNAEVLAYLAKVQATEAQPPAIWQKNILHFAGGFSPQEVNNMAGWLGSLAAIATDTAAYLGGNVVTFKKLGSDVIVQASADSVRHYIEDQGVTLMTFLAHAYSASFDITIDEPENYDWNGKHPVILGNSCYIGNFHGNGATSASERWVLMPDAGPIAFIAAAEQGFTGWLLNYSSPFYDSFARVNHGGSIGEHMKHAGLTCQVISPTSYMAWNVQNFALQGDPTITLNSHRQPDYTVSADRILIEPANVTADVDSFTVKVAVENIGRAVNATINVELKRSNPGLGANPVSYFTTLSDVDLRDTAVFRVPTLGFSGGQGTNQLQVLVDLEPDQVDELVDDANNTASTALFIASGDLVPAWPYDFAIVPEPTVTLKASTGDPLAPVRTYVFQIDTTDLFNSPIRETHTLQAPGGVVSWQPQSIFALNALQDSTVFYWRCSIDSASSGNGQFNWYERSFQYIPQRWGWGQAHYFQFKNDVYSGIRYDRPERDFDFEEGQRLLRATVLGNVGGPATAWFMELSPQDYGGCGPAAWHVAVVDPVSFEPWGTYYVNPTTGQVYYPENQFGNYNNAGGCRNRPEGYFGFHTSSAAQLTGLQGMLSGPNAIPAGHHVLMYTWLYLDKDGMAASNPALMPYLESIGFPSFAALPDSVPYIAYFRQGDPSTFRDTVGAAITDQISLSAWVSTAFAQGTITTMDAGPASSWHGLYWNELPAVPTDSTRIKLFGIGPAGGAPVPLADLHSPLDSLPDLGDLVDAQQYPILRIRGEFRDNVNGEAVPAQLERWQLLFSPVPECAIHPPLGLYNGLEGHAEGQQAAVAVAVQNISPFDMDSLLLTAWVVNRANVRHRVHYRLNAPLPAGAWLVDTVRFSTVGFGGWNTLMIEANPVDTLTGRYHQAEQYRFNNIAQWRFEVDEDRENPLLDVTFDGRFILDGDIVSARPEIEISLDDENTIRLLDSPADTASFKVFLTRPGAGQQRIHFRDGAGNEVMRFQPASGTDNIARIRYSPRFDSDGRYCLTVQASDLSGNASGDNDYKVCFEVVNRTTITDVLNYPNPFTTSTRFVFTLTGSEPPSQMRIQILTVTGKVVREVSMAELGPIHVGRNITEFAWDGTDQFGDRLARGVYLYRVMARLNGEDIEVRETQASQYFTKGFGKMYLLR